jgi:hypothetical protein
MIGGIAMFLAIGVLAQAGPEQAPAGREAPAPVIKASDNRGPRSQEIVIPGPKGEELICKKYQPVGSRLPIRACRTAYDWAELNAASLRDLDQMTSKGTYP